MIPPPASDFKKWLKYLLIVLLCGVLISCTGFIFNEQPQAAYVLNCILFLVAGVFYWIFFKKAAGMHSNFDAYFYVTAILSYFFIVVGYLIAFSLFSGFFKYNFLLTSYIWISSVSSVLTIVPMLAEFAFGHAIAIRPKEYKTWVYPQKTLLMDRDKIDVTKFSVINFVFSKKYGDTAISNFQSKAPNEIKLGDLFYFFVQEWNHKNPGNTIEYAASNGMPFGWHFTIRKSWWQPKFYLDPDLTVRENNIKLNQTIKTNRVLL